MMSTHPDDERHFDSSNYIWYRGRLVEQDHPDVEEDRKRRAARRCQIDYPFDTEEYEYEDDRQA